MRGITRRGGTVLALALAFLLAGMIQTSPLTSHFFRAVPYSAQPHPGHEIVPIAQGDHLQLIYHFWLFEDSLESGRPFFSRSLEFSVEDREPFFSPQFFPLSFGYWLFSPFGAAGAYNFLVLSSYLFAGLAGYLLCRSFFPPLPSFVGGLLFALFPFRYGQLMGGHSNGFVSFFTPLSLALLISAFRQRIPAAAAGAGAAFLFLAATDLTAAYFTAFLFFPLLALLLCTPVSEWLLSPTTDNVPPPLSLRHLPAGALPPLLIGTVAGSAWYFAGLRAIPSAAPWSAGLLALPFHGLLLLLLWRLLALFMEKCLFLSPENSEKAGTFVVSPFLLLALYPVTLTMPIPYWGRFLAVASAAASLLCLALVIGKSGTARGRTSLSPFLRRRALVLTATLIPVILALGLVQHERRSHIADSSIGGGRSYDEVKIYSPGPDAFTSRDYGDAEKILYPGLVALALLAFFLRGLRSRHHRPKEEGLLLFFTVAGLLAALLALGPRGEMISPLFPLLRRLVPLYDLSRAPSRIYLITAVGLTLASAGGMAVFSRIFSARGLRVVTIIVVLLLLRDFHPPHSPGLSGLPRESTVHRQAASELDGGRLMDVPIWPGDSSWSSLYLYYATLYGTPTINGYSPMVPARYFDTVFRPLEDMNLGEMRLSQYHLLEELDVKFVVFHENAFPPKVSPYPFQFSLDNLQASPFLELLARDGPRWLFRVLPDGEGEAVYDNRSVMGKVFEGEDLLRPPGEAVDLPGSSGGKAAEYGAGAPLPLNRPFPVKGFYPTGRYRFRVSFDTGAGLSPPGLEISVRNPLDGTLLGSAAAPFGAPLNDEASSSFFLDGAFELPRPAPLAFELRTDGRGPLRWDFLTLVHAGEVDPRGTYEAEDLVHMGETVDQTEAGGGKVVRLLPDRDPSDYVLSGPDRLYPPGRYLARLFLGASVDGSGSLGRFEARLGRDEGILGEASLDGGALSPGGERVVELEFTLSREVPVRFQVFYHRRGVLDLDRLEVTEKVDR